MAEEERLSSNEKLLQRSESTNTKTNETFTFFNSTLGKERGQTASEILDDPRINFTPVINPINFVEQPSYHWTFFIGPDIGPFSLETKTIIAETGVTGSNIQEVFVDAMVGPNAWTQNQNATSFRIKIVDPIGSTLPDAILRAAASMGVSNYMKCPYYLLLELRGSHPITGAPIRMIGGKTWLWRIMLSKLTSDVTTTGTIHNLEAFAYNELGFRNQFNILPEPVSVDLGSLPKPTIGDAMKGLIDSINRTVRKRYGYQFLEYEIQTKPYPSEVQSPVATPFDHEIVRANLHQDSSRNQKMLQVSRGTDISRVIDYLVSASETGVRLANPADSSEEIASLERPATTVVHSIEVKTENIAFDPMTRDYRRKIIFIIRPYQAFRTVLSNPQLTNMEHANINDQKAKEAVKRSFMKKEYNYTYTGKNTEILNLDISLNFQFNVASNMYRGFYFYEMASPGKELDEKTRTLLKVKELKELNAQQDSLIQQLNQNPNDASLDKRFTFLSNRINTTIYGEDGISISQKKLEDEENARKPKTLSGSNYVDNLETTVSTSTLPISFVQDGADPRYQVQPSIESNNLRGKSIYGMILNQLYGTFDGNLQNLQLEIRGDPYWIGLTNMDDSQPEGTNTDSIPDFLNGEHIFILKFYIPRGINENTGDPVLDISDMYSGFYAVNKVEHQFASGYFKQILHGVRIPGWEISRLLGLKS